MQQASESVSVHFDLSDAVYANATFKDVTAVGLWLGANVVSPYPVRNDICGLPLPESRWIDRSRTARVGPEPARQNGAGWLVCLFVCVFVWQMLEYPFDEANALLNKNMTTAKESLATVEKDLSFIKDQITTTEVMLAARSVQHPARNPEQCNTGHGMQHARHSMVGREGPGRVATG